MIGGRVCCYLVLWPAGIIAERGRERQIDSLVTYVFTSG